MTRRQCHSDRSRRRGFTLVEVIIVVLIIGILSAMTIPLFGQTELTKLKAAAELLAADIAYAQVESIAHGDDLRLMVFDLESNSYSIVATSAPDTPITNPIGRVPYVVTFGQNRAAELGGVTIHAISVGGDDRFRFGMYGELDQAVDATITLAAAGKTITLTIDAVNGEVSFGSIE